VTTLVAVWLDDAVHFTTGPEEQKAINLRTNQNVLLLTGCNDWEHGLDVVVEGTAIQVRDNDTLKALAEVWARKWDGSWQFEARDGAFHHPDAGTALVFSGRAGQGTVVRKGHVHSNPAPVLMVTARQSPGCTPPDVNTAGEAIRGCHRRAAHHGPCGDGSKQPGRR
jgi:hypothetical protein